MIWARGQASTPASQLVLFGLADAADVYGITYIGQASLAQRCSCGERTVRENLALLERDSLIARRRRNNARGNRSSDYTVLAPLAFDRGSMLDADEDCEKRYPPDVVEIARLHGNPFLPADDATRDSQPADHAVRDEVLPADDAEPTGGSLHPYRQITPSLPAPSAGEVVVEVQPEKADESSAADAAPIDPAEAERWAAFQAWRAKHPKVTSVSTAWTHFTAEQNGSEEEQAAA